MPWFKPFGLVFRPVSIAGWIITLLAAAFCIHIFLFVDGRSHSVSDTFYGIFPYCVPTFLLWLWIASRTSGARDPRIPGSAWPKPAAKPEKVHASAALGA